MRYLLIFVASFLTFFSLLIANPNQSFARNPRIEVAQKKQTITPKPTEKIVSKETQQPVSLNDVQKYIMNGINEYRKTNGLYEVKTDSYTCDFASVRAKEIAVSFSHDGFKNRINSKTLPYPSYSQVTENLAKTSDYKKVVTLWINSSGHAENMRKDTPYVCVVQNGSNYAYEGWRP